MLYEHKYYKYLICGYFPCYVFLFMKNLFARINPFQKKHIKKIESIFCTQCNMEKHIKDFYNKKTECKEGNCKRGLKRYYDNKDKISNHQEIYSEKN